ncbi:MAG TPA: hypothetical protein DCE41_31535 [Cytophagales bacterium]|nr:hypothetical protein [Cytophagales bacterium]HAA18993.1 hypothetical protein [Cytophagales bacterium]HAP61830.1 hypothetical protein [Cytophagales bacterium]
MSSSTIIKSIIAISLYWSTISTTPAQSFSEKDSLQSVDSILNFARLGFSVRKRQQWDSTILLFNSSLRIAEAINNQRYINSSLLHLGHALKENGQYKQAISTSGRLLGYITIDHPQYFLILTNYLEANTRIGNFSVADSLLAYGIEQAKIRNDSSSLAEFYLQGNVLGIEQSKLDLALAFNDSAMSFFQALTNQDALNNLKANRGIILSKQGDLDGALQFQLQALDWFIMSELIQYQGKTYNSITDIFIKQRNLQTAKKYLEQGLSLAEKESRLQGYLFMNLGKVFHAEKEYDSARVYYYKALDIWQFQKDPEGVINSIGYLISSELESGEISENMVPLISLGDSWRRQSEDSAAVADFDLSIAAYYLSVGELSQVEAILNRAEPILVKQGIIESLIKLTDLKRKLYAQTENSQELLAYLDRYDSLQGVVLNSEQQRNTQELETQYETRKTTEELNLVNGFLLAANEKNELQQRNQYLLLAILGLIIALAVALGLGYRAVRRKNTVIQKLNAEINHRTLNHLAFIQKFYALEVRAATHSEQREAMQAGMAKLESMVALYRQLYNDLDEKKSMSLRTYLINLLEKLMELSSLPEDTIQLSGPELELDVEEMKLIGLIATELVTNAVKYGMTPERNLELYISWDFKADGKLCLRIADNGPGLPDAVEVMRQKSFGLNVLFLIAEKQLKGSLGYAYNQGAEWTLQWASKAQKLHGTATA